MCVYEREREGGRESGGEGERERKKKVSTNRMLFRLLQVLYVDAYTVISMLLVCTQYSRYVFPCTVYSLDHTCRQDPGWSQVDTDSLCKHHTRHWASWIDSQCTHTSTRTHTISTYQYVNAKIHGFLILAHKMINIH